MHSEIEKCVVLAMDGEYAGIAGAYSCHLIGDEKFFNFARCVKRLRSLSWRCTRVMVMMIVATLLISGIDTIDKWLSDSIAAGQVIWSRFLFHNSYSANNDVY